MSERVGVGVWVEGSYCRESFFCRFACNLYVSERVLLSVCVSVCVRESFLSVCVCL